MTDDREDRKSSNGGFDLRNEDCPKYRCFIGTVNACCIDQILRNSLQRLANHTQMTDEFLAYARPLIQAELTPLYIAGLPHHIYMKNQK